MDRSRRISFPIRLTAWAGVVCLAGAATSASHAATEAAPQCSRAIAAAKARIVAADTRVLNRCVLSLLEPGRGRPSEQACRALRTPGAGLDRKDRSARGRIQDRCARTRPDWLPGKCQGPGPATGGAVNDPSALADCAVRGAHCLAVWTISSTYGDVWPRVSAQHPANLDFEYSQVGDNSLRSCLDRGIPASTTSTTMAPVETTTTTVAGPIETTTTSTTLAAATTTTTVIAPGPPRLVITEIMSNPDAQSDASGEYFEVFNPGPAAIDILGLVVTDLGSDSLSVQESVSVAAGAFAILARSASAAGGLVDYIYGSAMNLTNSSDAIILTLDGNELDRVVYDATFPLAAGVSMQLDPSATSELANDDASAWCLSTAALPDGDAGSPASANAACGS